jgi:hypothetical protein
MSSPERIYSGSIRTLSFIFVALGLLILISTFANGGGPLSLGVLLGVAFLAVGIARLWLSGVFRGWRGGRGGSDG